jgi:glyoxylase-like metal-dependent hydrolase (beta-lactamase superfamily II)
MPASGVIFVSEMSNDSRVRVYRSSLSDLKEFGGMEVDGYLLATDRFLLLCDTLIYPEGMSTVTQAIQGESVNRPLLIMNSHADWDHAWGNSYFTGERIAPIIAHEHCRERMESEKEKTVLANYKKRYPSYFQNVVLTPPTVTFSDRLALHGGDLTIELFRAPGHCQDHIAAWIPELRLLLAFDAVETPVPLIENAVGVQSMFTTLEHFLSLRPQRVLCSHGKTTSPTIIEANLTYCREIERRCRAVLARYQPTKAELEQASTLIGYSFDAVMADAASMIEVSKPVDHSFYSQAHEDNVRYIMLSLMMS